ncbi:MAG: iron complex transport system substrate-binding protein [Cellvibrionaceae bacterium]|jgi:iron complex transport system substrate-binding protein
MKNSQLFMCFTALLLCCSSVLVSANNVNKETVVVSCDREVRFSETPQYAVSHDINMTEMMLALGLQKHMVGYTGVEGGKDNDKVLDQYSHKPPSLSRHAPNIETLLTYNVDFLFAGWNYGLTVGGTLTPEKLAEFNIAVYELAESCIHIMDKKPGGFNDVYTDLLNLGVIFSQQKRAKKLVDQLKSQLSLLAGNASKKSKPRVFLFDSGFDTPFTSGLYAMPHAMIEAAGGDHIFSDLEASWTRVSWEVVVSKNPEMIVIVDYGKISVQEKIDFLTNESVLSGVDAIKNKRFIVLTYNEVTPSIQAINATERLHDFIHSSQW